MIYRDSTGELKVRFSRQEIINALEKWRQKPETKEMFAKFAAERQAFIDGVVATIKARTK